MFNHRNCLSAQVFLIPFFLAVSFCQSSHANNQASSLGSGIGALAAKVASISNSRGPLLLVWRNNSALSNAQSEIFRNQFQRELASMHVVLTEDASAPPLQVTISDTPTRLVFVASLRTVDGDQMRLEEVARSAFSSTDRGPSAPRPLKQLLWKQRDPILDAVERAGPQPGHNTLLLLEKDSLVLYEASDEQWYRKSSATIPAPAHSTRELYGRIRFNKNDSNGFTLDLPGRTCSGTLAEESGLECVPGDHRGGKQGNATEAPISLHEGIALTAACDHTEWLLYSGKGDWTRADQLMLRNLMDDRPRLPGNEAPSASIDVPGPVISLASGPDASSGIAVVFNLTTGNYEVYSITLACGN